MPDSGALDAERRLQQTFRNIEWVQLLTLGAIVLLFGWWARLSPNRVELGERQAKMAILPVSLDPRRFGKLRLAGAWEMHSDDPRVGGVSALAIDGRSLIALTDSGGLVRFARPGSRNDRALVRELPGGPGDPSFKSSRDTEALVRDPAGRGWWVAFENRNQLWFYDKALRKPLGRIRFARKRWPRNRGIEALVVSEGALLLFAERGDEVLELRGRKVNRLSVAGSAGRISDAVRLPSGQLMVLNRRLTLRGFVNGLATLKRTPGGYRYGWSTPLGLSPLENAEALAAEPLPDGGARLWVMTDNNFQRRMRTLLVALDMPPEGLRR